MKDIEKQKDDTERTGVSRSIWTVLIISAAELAFFIFALTLPRVVWHDYLLTIVPGLLSAIGLISVFIIRRGWLELGVGIVFVGNLILATLATTFQDNLGPLAAAYISLSSFLIIFWVLPEKSRRWATACGLIAFVGTVIIEILNPPFRVSTPELLSFAPIVTVLMALALAFLVARQAWAGNYRTKLIATLVSVVIITAGTLAFLNQRASAQALTQSVGILLKNNAEASAIQLGDLLNQQIEVLTTLSLNEVLQAGVQASNTTYIGDSSTIQTEVDRLDQQWRAAVDADNNDEPLVWDRMHNEVSSDLLEFQSFFPAHAEVFLTDRYGALVATTNRTTDYYQADESWWQNAYNSGLGAVYISMPRFIPDIRIIRRIGFGFKARVGEFGLLIAIPIRHRDTKQILGVLHTTYLLTALQELLDFTKIGATGKADIIFPGETIQHIHEDKLEPVEPQEWEQLQALSGVAYAEMNIEGTPNLVSQAHVTFAGNPAINDLGWLVTVHQTSEEALATVTAQTRNAVILGVIIAVVASAAAVGLAHVLVAPILRLTAATQQVAGGDLTARATVETGDEVGTLAETFNSMTAQLGDLIGTLEQRVVARTRALETSADVSRRLSTILDQRQLVREVVGQLQAAFGYYHVHIYLGDENRENMVMVGGTGEAGQTMMARGHKITWGRGLVGRTAQANAPVLVTDTSRDPDWLPNPLLPETRSELAVPIAIGDNVLGVLDVQHNITRGLGEEDTTLLQSIANQVAVALQNTQAYTQAQRQAEREALLSSVGEKIRSTTNVEDALKITVRELGRLIGVPTGVRLRTNAMRADPAKGNEEQI